MYKEYVCKLFKKSFKNFYFFHENVFILGKFEAKTQF